MKEEIKDKWLQALRSGSYSQAKYALHTEGGEFCCLGVLCDLAVKEGVIPSPEPQKVSGYWKYNRDTKNLPLEVMKWAGVRHPAGEFVQVEGSKRKEALVSLNDFLGKSFSQIANIIEDDWERL